MHLYSRSPPESIYILSGVPPSEAIIHIKIVSLLSMISRLPSNNHLYRICLYLLREQLKQRVFKNIVLPGFASKLITKSVGSKNRREVIAFPRK